MNPNFWKLLFVVCHALYALMQVPCLADQKTPTMDKLYYYVLQTDWMLPKYLCNAEEPTTVFWLIQLSQQWIVFHQLVSAGCSEDADEDKDEEDDGEDLMAPDVS